MDSGSPKVIFSSVEMDPDQLESQPLRISGVISLLLGLISAIALAGPYMWVVPILAVLVGLFALRPSKLPYTGKAAALIGLGLGLFFLTWAATARDVVEQVHLEKAKRFVTQWLDSFQSGEPEFCFEMTLPEDKRLYKSVNLATYYANPVDSSDVDGPPGGEPKFSEFIEQPLVKSLLNAEKKPQWQYAGVIKTLKLPGMRRWTLRFEDTSGTLPQPVAVIMEVKESPDGEYRWQVQNISEVEQ